MADCSSGAELLKYMERTNRDRYERVLERLRLAHGTVKGERIVFHAG